MHVNLDPFLVDKIVGEVKSQGVFDQFRRDSMSDVDTKPAYQNLRQRVEASVFKFLSDLKWKPEINKNQLREKLRKHITDAGFLDTGVERIVDQVVNPKISTIFQPKIEDIAYKYLGVEKPQNKFAEKNEASENGTLSIKTDLLPTDLEAVSPDSESKSDSKDLIEHFNDTEEKNDEFESPPFEPLEGRPPTPIQDERSNQSHLSGISGLTSQDSISSERELHFKKEHCSMHESVLSQVSSSSRLSIALNDEEKVLKPEVEAKPTADMSEEAQMPSFPNSNDSKTKSALHFDINKQEFKFEGTKSKFTNSFYGKSKKNDLECSQHSDKKSDKSLSNEVSNSTSCGSEGDSKELSNDLNLGLYETLSKEPNSSTVEALKLKEPATFSNTYVGTEKLNSFDFRNKSNNTCKKIGRGNRINSRKSKDGKSKSYHPKKSYYKECISRESQEKLKERVHGDKHKFSPDEKNDTKAKKNDIDDHSSYRIKAIRRKSTESDDEGEKNLQKANFILKQEISEKTREATCVKNTSNTNTGKQKSESNGNTHPAEEISTLEMHKVVFETKITSDAEEDVEFRYFEVDTLEEQNENKKIECLSKLIEELVHKNTLLPEFKAKDDLVSSSIAHSKTKITDVKKLELTLGNVDSTSLLQNQTEKEGCDGIKKRKEDEGECEAYINEKRRKGLHDCLPMTLPLSEENVRHAKNFLSTDFSDGSITENNVDIEFSNVAGQKGNKNLTVPFQANITFKGQSFIDVNGKSVGVVSKAPTEKKSIIGMKGTQRYSNEDLYKPRPALTSRPRRRLLDNEVV